MYVVVDPRIWNVERPHVVTYLITRHLLVLVEKGLIQGRPYHILCRQGLEQLKGGFRRTEISVSQCTLRLSAVVSERTFFRCSLMSFLTILVRVEIIRGDWLYNRVRQGGDHITVASHDSSNTRRTQWGQCGNVNKLRVRTTIGWNGKRCAISGPLGGDCKAWPSDFVVLGRRGVWSSNLPREPGFSRLLGTQTAQRSWARSNRYWKYFSLFKSFLKAHRSVFMIHWS